MYSALEINVFSDNHYQNIANIIFNNSSFLVDESAQFLNFMENYQPSLFENSFELYYILFNGRKIKLQLTNKKTLLVIRKLGAMSMSFFNSFHINQHNYPIDKVEHIILCDLLYAKGGIFDANEIHAAVFFPYFME